MTLRTSLVPLSRPGTRRLLSRLTHTGTVFFQDWTHIARVLLTEHGRYISTDPADVFSRFMVNGMPDLSSIFELLR